MVPNSRATFKEYCLRKLGSGVLRINVSDDQVDDRVDQALRFWWDYHFEGSDRVYYKHVITQDDKNNGYIELPENIIGAVRIFNPSVVLGSNMLFNAKYQLLLNEMINITSRSMVPYYMTMQNIQMLQQLLEGEQQIRFNRYHHKIYIDTDWDAIIAGQYIIVEGFEVIDPEVYTSAYGDRLLQNYTTALIKQQWGSNLKKFSGMQMPGGIAFNGQEIYNEATAEISQIEHEIIYSYSLPAADIIM